MKIFSEKINVSCFWRNLSNEFPNYRQNFLDRAFKTEVYVSRGYFQGKIFREYFFWTSSSEFCIFRRNSNRFLVKTIINSFRGLFGKKFWIKKFICFYYLNSGFWQKIPILVGKFSARLSKVHSKCPIDIFGQSIFFGKLFFCFFSEFVVDLFGLWGQKFQLGCQNCILNLQRNTLSRKVSRFSKF